MSKKRIAFDTSSLRSDHRFRGIGFYTKNLLAHLERIAERDDDVELVPFADQVPEADLYHFPAFNPFFFSFPFNIVSKSIITVHDLIPIQYAQHYPAGLKGNLRWQVQKMLLQKSKAIITDSSASAYYIREIIKYPKQRTHVVYLAADKQFRLLDKAEMNAADPVIELPEKFALYVGDLNWNKNVMMLAKVCVKINIPLVVVGKQATNSDIDRSHPWNAELVAFQEFAKQHANTIYRLGFVAADQLVALYNMTSVYVQPSIAEGFGLPVLEAMQCGCLVLASKESSLPEIAGDGALYFNPSDPYDLEKQLSAVWENPDSAYHEKLKLKAIQKAKEFSWTKTANQTWELYKRYL